MTELINDEIKRRILEKVGALVEMKAKMNCPVDLGVLRASIQHKVIGDSVVIYSDIEYARDMEYGTPPGDLNEGEKEDIREWAKRHDLPENAVVRKIQLKGIKVGTVKQPMKTPSGYRPFLRPALHQSISDIRKIIRSELS